VKMRGRKHRFAGTLMAASVSAALLGLPGPAGPGLAGAPAAAATSAAADVLAGPASSQPVPVPLTPYLNNDGIGSAPGQANFDGSGYSYPASQLPAGQTVTLGGIPYDFPAAAGNDNVAAVGQSVTLPQGHDIEAFLLVASSYGPASGTAVVHYTDGSTTSVPVTAPDWYSGGTGLVNPGFRYTPTGTDQHPVAIFGATVWMDPSRTAQSITLPTTAAPKPNTASMHIFAMTLQPAVQGSATTILGAQSTTKQIPENAGPADGYADGHGPAGKLAQVVEATVQNIGTDWVDTGNPVTVTVRASGVTTAVPARITSLGPGEQAQVQVGVVPTGSVPAGTREPATLIVQYGHGQTAQQSFTLTVGIPDYTATNASLDQHMAPDWYDNAKFGIFIHWGVYSVPAWAPVGGVYAEWYWNSLHSKGSPTYEHQLQTYGPNSYYDQFIPDYTAADFDPKAWVQLFQQAGARYFVLVSKHHEGFANFKTSVSNRNSVAMGPHQDIVGELFQADRTYTPGIHPGLYYSLPEWYNPAYPGDGPSFPGGPPTNWYTGKAEPYTGYIPVSDYVNDFQVPQMMELIKQYHPDIFWCDIGGPNNSLPVMAYYYNQAKASGQGVAVDDRCGVQPHDFTTPEYTKYSSTVTSKWESNRGLDPHSYGYNSATPAKDYMTVAQAVQDLVDIVSKNGNLLLDIGPEANGTIPQVMQQRLRGIGEWLKVNGQAIYGTTYWWRTPQDGNLRFTIAPNKAFYITSLTRPGSQVVVNEPVPIRAGDQITLLGYHGKALTWTDTNGTLTIDVPPAAQRSGKDAWVFKIAAGPSATFTLSHLHVSPQTVQNRSSGPQPGTASQPGPRHGLATASVQVTNTGPRAGADTVQFLLTPPAGVAAPPGQAVASQQVYLRPGQSRTVRASLDGQDLSYWDQSAGDGGLGGPVVPDGTFQVGVADPASGTVATVPLTVSKTVGARYATINAPANHSVAPDSSFPVSARFVNDGDYALHHAQFSLSAPRGWTVTPAGGPAPTSVAAHQTVVRHWTVTVPEEAQNSAGRLVAQLTSQPKAAGTLAASVSVPVLPAVQVAGGSGVSASLTAGSSATTTLTLTDELPRPVPVTVTPKPVTSGLTGAASPATVTLQPGPNSVRLTVTAAAALKPGSYTLPVDFSVSGQGHTYQLIPLPLPVQVMS
jgi:alpha-L-fucosidase